jgi:exodeoxyribonuclease VII small subunit
MLWPSLTLRVGKGFVIDVERQRTADMTNEPLPDNLSFEESLIELERTVRELEDGRLGLEDALSSYERGVGLIKKCYNQLRQAEQRILLLTGTDEAGQPLLQPFKHEATAPARGAASRLRKKPEAGD